MFKNALPVTVTFSALVTLSFRAEPVSKAEVFIDEAMQSKFCLTATRTISYPKLRKFGPDDKQTAQ